MGILEGKVAVITGTGAGIGKQTAIRFAEEGAKIIMCDYNEEKLKITEEILKEKGAEVFSMIVDINETDQIKAFIDAGVERFGTIDTLLNIAVGGGTNGGPTRVPFAETPLDYFHSYNRASVAYAYLMQCCYPFMKGKESSVINFSSFMHYGSQQGDPLYLSAGAMSKAAVAGLTRVVADEWGLEGIRVNMIYPSAVTDTLKGNGYGLEMMIEKMSKNAFKRPGDPYRDIAGVCVFLASDDSRFLTGQSFFASGGASMGRA